MFCHQVAWATLGAHHTSVFEAMHGVCMEGKMTSYGLRWPGSS